MAGGQGTRLGHNGPKGTFDLGLDSHKSIFEILCEHIKEARAKYGVDIPWYLMTSDENNDDTVKFFLKNIIILIIQKLQLNSLSKENFLCLIQMAKSY